MASMRRCTTVGLVAAALLLFTGVAGADTPDPESDAEATTSAAPAPEDEAPKDEAPEVETASGRCWSGDATRDGLQGANAGCSPFAHGERVRVIVRCDGFWPWSDYTRVGPWENRAGYTSEAYCDAGDDREGHNFQSDIAT